MYAQLTYFDGPRTPEQLTAEDLAGQERILPAVSKLGHPLRVYLLRRHDGSEIVVTIADSEQALLDTQKAIMTTDLLPGPDRIELYPVVAAHDVNPASKTRSGL